MSPDTSATYKWAVFRLQGFKWEFAMAFKTRKEAAKFARAFTPDPALIARRYDQPELRNIAT